MFNAVFDAMPNLKLITTQPVKDPKRPDRYLEIQVSC